MQTVPEAPEIEAFLKHYEDLAGPRERALGEAYWSLATTGTREAQERLVERNNFV